MQYSGTLRMLQGKAMIKMGLENAEKIRKFKEKELGSSTDF